MIFHIKKVYISTKTYATSTVRLLLAGVTLVCVCILLITTITLIQQQQREIHSYRDKIGGPTDRYISVGGLEMHYTDSGPANGKVILLIHGTGAWGALWQDTTHYLISQGYRVLALDLPPFGYSEKIDDYVYSTTSQASRVSELIHILKLREVTLIGHSFGSRVTLETALRDAPLISNLILVDPAIDFGTVEMSSSLAALRKLLEFDIIRNALVRTAVTQPSLTGWFLSALVYQKDAVTTDRVRILSEPLGLQGATHAIGRWVMHFLFDADADTLYRRSDILKAFRSSALVLWGDQDTITPHSIAQSVADSLPGSVLKEIPGVGHIPQIEDPARFNRMILEFILAHP